MDFPALPRLRDRRVAAGEETAAVQAGQSIYGVGSRARSVGSARARRPDRAVADITTIILHQTAGHPISGLQVPGPDDAERSDHRVDRIAAHFVVGTDGTLFYTHDVTFIMANAGGRRGIDIEFAGSFRHTLAPAGDRLTPEAIHAGRALVAGLARAIPSIGHIHPHGQVGHGRDDDHPGPKFESCCGPDIWMNVGDWAVRVLRLIAARTDGRYDDHGIAAAQSNAAYVQTVGPTRLPM